MAGYMEVTGERSGPPMLAGIPVIDLKAGDELYASVMRALLERHETGLGQAIHISMLQAAASWLITVLPLIDFGCREDEITRAATSIASSYRPTSTRRATASYSWPSAATCNGADCAPCPDLPASPMTCARPTRVGTPTREAIHRDMAAVTQQHSADDLLADLRSATIPATRIHDIRQVRELPALAGKLTRTTMPDGRVIHMPPMAVDLPQGGGELGFRAEVWPGHANPARRCRTHHQPD
jgi:itaconate CoA-transferase